MFSGSSFLQHQAIHNVRKKAGVTEEEWDDKLQVIVSEHDLPGAREQLASGWKEYLESHRGGQVRAAGVLVQKPASLATLVLDDWED